MASLESSDRPRRSPARILLFLLILAGGAVATAEIGVRVRAHLRYGELLEIGELFDFDEQLGIRVGKPNLDVFFAKESQVNTDSFGFRSAELEQPKPEGRFRLAFLGGSTTFNSFASSNETMWSYLVTKGLAERFPEADFDYVCGGVTGYRVKQSRIGFEHRIQPLEPDLVFIYHATNDLAEDSHGLAQAAGLVPAPRAPGFLEERSVLWRLIVKNLRYGASQEAGLSEVAKLAFDPTETSPGFEERLRGLVEEVQATGAEVVLVTFTTKFRAEQPLEVQLANLQQSFTFMPYLSPQDTLAGYVEYNRVIEKVAGETGALLIDERFSIPGDAAHFDDSVHFSDKGLEAQAARGSGTVLPI